MRVTNKARVEGSIVEATIAKEIGTFAKDYFAEKQHIGQGGQTSNRSAGKLSILRTVSLARKDECLSLKQTLMLHMIMSSSIVRRFVRSTWGTIL